MNMNEYCNRFFFATDMNGDLAFTITDLWLISKFMFLLPAKIIVGLVHNSDMATFFEVNCATGESWGGAWFSLVVWAIVFIFIRIWFEELLSIGSANK